MENNSNKFKLVLMGIFGFCILLGLIAFSSFKSTNSASNKIEIKIWGTVDKTIFDNFITKYTLDKGLQFSLQYTYKSIDTIDSQLVEAIATSKAPDSILIPQTLIKRYLDKVYLIPSPERTFKDTFVQESELYIQPGGIFGLPFFVDPLIMYWNKDMFLSANIALPPSQWSEFPLLAGKLTKIDNNSNVIQSVAALGEYVNIDNIKALLSALIIQAGSPIVSLQDGSYKSMLDYQSPLYDVIPSESALQFFTDYSNPKKSVYSWNRSLPSSKQSFLSGDLATYFGFASEYKDMAEKNPNLNFDVAVLPQIVDAKIKSTFGELYGFAVLKSSPNIPQTLNLLSMLIGADSISTLLQFLDVAPARLDLIAAGSQSPSKTIFYNSSLISKGWIDPDAKITSQIFKDMIENITTGKTDIGGSVTKASAELNNLLK